MASGALRGGNVLSDRLPDQRVHEPQRLARQQHLDAGERVGGGARLGDLSPESAAACLSGTSSPRIATAVASAVAGWPSRPTRTRSDLVTVSGASARARRASCPLSSRGSSASASSSSWR